MNLFVTLSLTFQKKSELLTGLFIYFVSLFLVFFFQIIYMCISIIPTYISVIDKEQIHCTVIIAYFICLISILKGWNDLWEKIILLSSGSRPKGTDVGWFYRCDYGGDVVSNSDARALVSSLTRGCA